jgi:hypothetical protein
LRRQVLNRRQIRDITLHDLGYTFGLADLFSNAV